MKNTERKYLYGILGLGLLLRVLLLNSRSIQYDDAFSILFLNEAWGRSCRNRGRYDAAVVLFFAAFLDDGQWEYLVAAVVKRGSEHGIHCLAVQPGVQSAGNTLCLVGGFSRGNFADPDLSRTGFAHVCAAGLSGRWRICGSLPRYG